MNLRKVFLPSIVVLAVLLSSCGSGTKNASSTTGWEYNSPDNGGIFYSENTEQKTGPGLVLIEGGAFIMGRTTDDIEDECNNVPRKVTIASFYIDETEVRNIDYREYLRWLER